jgi:hypothetical protein
MGMLPMANLDVIIVGGTNVQTYSIYSAQFRCADIYILFVK